MIKQNGSWWKDDRIPGLIARKQVDGFLFGHGFEIPPDFRADFAEELGSLPAVGESRPVRLLHQSGDTIATYEARLEHWRIAVPSGKSSLEIRYDSNKEFKDFLRSAFQITYREVKEWAARFAREQGGDGDGKETGRSAENGTSQTAVDNSAARPVPSFDSPSASVDRSNPSGSRRIPPRGSAEIAAGRNPFDRPEDYLPSEERAEYWGLERRRRGKG